MDFNFYMPVRVVSGKNALMNNKELLVPYGRTCGIVTGRTSAEKCGALDDLKKALGEIGKSYVVFSEVTENPSISTCFKAGNYFRENNVDFIFGIGGGSVLDAAKAIAIYTANPFLPCEDIYLRKYDNMPLPVMLIGTTSGTGSEVSGVSVLTNDRTGRKKSISGDDCYAQIVFADPRYTNTMNYKTTVSTSLDALCHAIEGYFSPKCTAIPTYFVNIAVPMLWEGIKALYRIRPIKIGAGNRALMNDPVPTAELHEKLYYGSLFAGMVLNPCGTVFPHPLGYVLTENYNIPHGKACACFMTDLMERASRYDKEKYDTLLQMMNTDRETFCKTIEKLNDMPRLIMTEAEITDYCSRWDGKTPGNFQRTPGGFTYNDAVAVFRKKFLR